MRGIGLQDTFMCVSFSRKGVILEGEGGTGVGVVTRRGKRGEGREREEEEERKERREEEGEKRGEGVSNGKSSFLFNLHPSEVNNSVSLTSPRPAELAANNDTI